MLSKNTKRLTALGITLTTLSGIEPLIISPFLVYAGEQDNSLAIQLKNAEDNLKAELDNYNYSSATTKENIDSILNSFSYTSTTESAVTIKAKACESFVNEESNCSFKVRLYDEANESNNKLVDFSYACNDTTTGSAVSMSLMSSSSPTEWTTSKVLNATGDTVIINGVKFSLADIANNYVSVVGYTGDIDEDLTLPSKIKCGDVEYTVKSIGSWAFLNCNLVKVVIPDSVTEILYGAFMECKQLENMQISDNVTQIDTFCFAGCEKLKEIILPKSLKTLGTDPFENCKSMIAITVPTDNSYFRSEDGVLYSKDETQLIKYPANKISSELYISSSTQIARWALNESSGLEAIKVDSGNPYHSSKDGVLYNKSGTKLVKYPGGKTTEEFEIPNTVEEMDEYAFSAADKLKSVKIPGNVKNIERYAFDGCSSLGKVDIGDGVEKIDYCAFSDCASLENIEIPSSVKEIYSEAFPNCNSLKNINVNINNSYFKSIDGVLYNYDATKIIQYPIGRDTDSYEIEDSVKTIGYSSFMGAGKLKNIIIPSEVTELQQYAFYGCSGLTNIDIPSKVTTLGWGAFQRCTGLTEVLVPGSVTKVDGMAFGECTGITAVFIPKELTNIDSSAFEDCDEDKISVFRYESSNNEIKIIGIYNDKIGENIVIPYEINKIRVTDIADDLFKGVSNIKSITCYDQKLNEKIQDLFKDEDGIIITGITAEGYSGKYDGNYHSIKVNNVPEGSIVTYSTSEAGIYSETKPSYKDKGTYTVYYKVLYDTEELHKGSVTISIGDCDHEYGEWMIRREPTYTEKGEKYRVCKICGEEQIEEIPMLEKSNPSNGGGSSSSSSSNESSKKETNNKIVINNSNDEKSIIDAINNANISIIEVNLEKFNSLNTGNGIRGAFLSEPILKVLKANPNKILILKGFSAASSENISINNAINNQLIIYEVKSTVDGQIQFTQNNIPLTGFVVVAGGEYALDSSGIMKTGWIQKSPSNPWYYYNLITGIMDKGWIQDNGLWYYLGVDGAMVTGWRIINGKWYLFNEHGAMLIGWVQLESKWYYLSPNGIMATGWINLNGNWYYLYGNGSLATKTTIDGYKVDENGSWVN